MKTISILSMLSFAFATKSYSQLKQDLIVLDFYKNKKNGYFVDIGAHDGISLSNSYLLEREFGWKGICVEPIPKIYERLKKNRKETTTTVNKGVYNTDGTILDFLLDSETMFSGISEDVDMKKLSKYEKINIETITLNKLLKDSNAPSFIEYLSLDTEGSEYKILEAFDFSKYRFGLIHLEHNYIEGNRKKIRDLLTSKGYKYLRENNFDDEYVHESLA